MDKRKFLLCSLFSIFICQAFKEKPLKSFFCGPLLPYVQTNYNKISTGPTFIKGPTLFGFAPGFVTHSKYMAENGVTLRHTFRANYAPKNLKKGMFASRFKDFDTSATIGHNFYESDHLLSNVFAGFAYNRCLISGVSDTDGRVTDASTDGLGPAINYNIISFVVGFNHEWELNENWGIGLDFAAKPDINPTAGFGNDGTQEFLLPMEYAYAFEGALDFAYQKKVNDFSISIALMPFVELAVYGKVQFFLTDVDKLTKLLAGGTLLFGIHF